MWNNEEKKRIEDKLQSIFYRKLNSFLSLSKEERSDLSELDLSNQELTSLPKEVYECSNLKTLNISENELEDIDENIYILSRLKLIKISHSSLRKIPKPLDYRKELFIEVEGVKILPIAIDYFVGYDFEYSISNKEWISSQSILNKLIRFGNREDKKILRLLNSEYKMKEKVKWCGHKIYDLELEFSKRKDKLQKKLKDKNLINPELEKEKFREKRKLFKDKKKSYNDKIKFLGRNIKSNVSQRAEISNSFFNYLETGIYEVQEKSKKIIPLKEDKFSTDEDMELC